MSITISTPSSRAANTTLGRAGLQLAAVTRCSPDHTQASGRVMSSDQICGRYEYRYYGYSVDNVDTYLHAAVPRRQEVLGELRVSLESTHGSVVRGVAAEHHLEIYYI